MGARLLRYASYPASLHGYRGRRKLTLSRRVATIWVVISLAVAVLIGVIGLAMSDVGALKTLTGSDSETIIVQIADLLSKHGILPALLAGTILAGILPLQCPRQTHSFWLHPPPYLPTFSATELPKRETRKKQ